MSLESSLFANHARTPRQYEFDCGLTCTVGMYLLTPGDKMTAVADGTGLYLLYVAWDERWIARVPSATINKLAGKEIIRTAHFIGGAQ